MVNSVITNLYLHLKIYYARHLLTTFLTIFHKLEARGKIPNSYAFHLLQSTFNISCRCGAP